MVCPKCGNKISELTIVRKGDNVFCSNCDEKIEFEESKFNSLDNQSLIKIVVGIGLIILGAVLLFRTFGAASNYKSIPAKYEAVTGSLLNSEQKNGGYTAYFEYEYNGTTYRAVDDIVYKSSDSVPKNRVIQVNKDNPEDYIFGTNEAPKINRMAYVIPVIVIIFGFLSVVLSIKKIFK